MLNRKIKALSIGIAITFRFAFVPELSGAVSGSETIISQTTAASKPTLKSLRQLIDVLKSRGKTVVRKERVEQPFLSVKGQIINIDEQDVQVFEYRTAHATQLDANKISRAGSSTTTSMPMWIAPPHFFKTGKLIVLYVGEDQSVLQTLGHVLGPQFAGK